MLASVMCIVLQQYSLHRVDQQAESGGCIVNGDASELATQSSRVAAVVTLGSGLVLEEGLVASGT